MRFLFTLFLATILSEIVGGNQNRKTQAMIQNEITQIEDRMKTAILGKDLNVLDHIYADDVAWTARGEVLTKTQVLAIFDLED